MMAFRTVKETAVEAIIRVTLTGFHTIAIRVKATTGCDLPQTSQIKKISAPFGSNAFAVSAVVSVTVFIKQPVISKLNIEDSTPSLAIALSRPEDMQSADRVLIQ
jgi:hypothetical protein